MKLLLVEDDVALREGLTDVLEEVAEVIAASTVQAGLHALANARFDLVLTDLAVDAESGGGEVVVTAARRSLTPVVIVTGSAEADLARRALAPDALLCKPFSLEELLPLVRRFLNLARAAQALSEEGAPAHAAWASLRAGVREAALSGEASGRWVELEPGHALPVGARGSESGVVDSGRVECDGRHYGSGVRFYLSGGSPPVVARERTRLLLLTAAS